MEHVLVQLLMLAGVCVQAPEPTLVPALVQAPEAAPDAVSAADWAGVRAAYEAGLHAVEPVDGGYEARNPRQAWQTRFDGRGFTTAPEAGAWTWGLELLSFGFAGQERIVRRPQHVSAAGGRVAYRWDATLTEWYVNDAQGLEHGYTLQRRPPVPEANAEDGPLRLMLAVRGELQARVTADGRDVRFVDAEGESVLTYSGLAVFDADGETLPARLERVDAGLLLTVDERGARYPLTIDPTAQRAYIKASNTDGDDHFGVSVSMSGNTIAVGANGEGSDATGIDGDESNNAAGNAGAVYVFVRSGASWTQQAYLKASNTGGGDNFGVSVSLSGDTLAVGAFGESSNATGVNGDELNNTAAQSGAAYIFVRNGTTWSQEAYIKASNTGTGDLFGVPVSLSGDTLAVAALGESSNATGINGNELDDSEASSGAVYVFVRSGTTWTQEAYVKASNSAAVDNFGSAVSLSGETLVVGALGEDGNTTGVNGDEDDNMSSFAGAAYVFVRSGTTWSQQAYLKASNTDPGDWFGRAVAVSGDTLIVGARENSNATGVNGDESDNSATNAGAAYVFVRSGTTWSQQAYLKASNTGAGDHFGSSVALLGDTAVVGAHLEDSNATGVNGDETDDSAVHAGAAYVFVRDGSSWSQQDYLKASNTDADDQFGTSVALAGNVVLVGAEIEDSGATGVNGNQGNGIDDAGAVYFYNAAQRTRVKVRRYTGPILPGGTISNPPFDQFAHAGDTTQAHPALRVAYDRGGVTAVLWLGTEKTRAGERWRVSPVLGRRLLVLDGTPGSPAGGAVDVHLPGLARALGHTPVYAQVVILDPVDGPALSPIVELGGSATER